MKVRTFDLQEIIDRLFEHGLIRFWQFDGF